MQANRVDILKSRFSVVLTDEEIAQFVMQGVMSKLGLVGRGKAVATVRDGKLTDVDVVVEQPITEVLTTAWTGERSP